MTTIIERILRDPDGTRLRLGVIDYHFKALWPHGPHVAAVDDEDHAAQLLKIKEGYREYEGFVPDEAAFQLKSSSSITTEQIPTIAPQARAREVISGPVGHDAPAAVLNPAPIVPPAGEPVPMVDKDAITHLDSAPLPPEQVGTPDSDPAQPEAEGVTPEPLEGGEKLADMKDEDLRALFELEVDRKPSPKAKRETMIAQIEAKRAEAGIGKEEA